MNVISFVSILALAASLVAGSSTTSTTVSTGSGVQAQMMNGTDPAPCAPGSGCK